MIYFIKDINNGSIKIGFSDRLSERIKLLANGLKSEIRVLAVVDGGRDEERAFHRKFSHLRIGESPLSEWFEPGDDLLNFIAQEGRPWDENDKSNKTFPVRLLLTPEDHDRLRIAAARRRMPMSQLARELVIEGIDLAMERISKNFPEIS